MFVKQPAISRPTSLGAFSLQSRQPQTIEIGAHFVLIIGVKENYDRSFSFMVQ